jgi:SagB-type dehydrogenase family enzyme
VVTAASERGYRVPPDLLISLGGGTIRAERPITGQELQASRDVLALLAVFRDGMTPAQLTAELTSRGYSMTLQEVSSALDTLLSAGVLDQQCPGESPDEATRVTADQTWGGDWDAAAYRFQWGTRQGPDRVGGRPPGDPPGAVVVPVFQRYRGVPLIPLPAPGELPAIPFREVLARRRTVREFAASPVALSKVSQLLYSTHHPHHLVKAPPYGLLPRRAYANGGARGELELYLLARDVAQLDRGLYHYRVDGHQLSLLGPDLEDAQFAQLAIGQEMCAAAPLTVFVTAVPRRCAAKYGAARALRVIYADAGCLAQTFGMVATGLGLGAYTTAAFCDRDVEQLLGLDGVRETPLLMLGAGVPAELRDQEQTVPCTPGVPLPGDLVEDIDRQDRPAT